MKFSRLFYFLLTIIVISSCGNNAADNKEEIKMPVPMTNLEIEHYLDSIAGRGSVIFKNNCASCHCGVFGSCDGGSNFRFQNVFNELPIDSLGYFMSFVKNSQTSTLNYGFESEHGFETKLTDKEIEIVIEYLWLQCQYRF